MEAYDWRWQKEDCDYEGAEQATERYQSVFIRRHGRHLIQELVKKQGLKDVLSPMENEAKDVANTAAIGTRFLPGDWLETSSPRLTPAFAPDSTTAIPCQCRLVASHQACSADPRLLELSGSANCTSSNAAVHHRLRI